MQFDYTVTSKNGFDETVERVKQATADAGFRVLAAHDIAATLAEKGFARESVTIIEVCNAKHASQVLAADVKIGLMLPCPIMVYRENDQVLVSTMRPTLIQDFYPEADITAVAEIVEQALFAITDKAAAAS